MPGPTNKHRYDEFHRGLVPQDHLGTGSGGAGAKFLADDQTWKTGAGAGALDDLTDVTITGVSDGDVLVYDSGTSEWVNGPPPSPTGLPWFIVTDPAYGATGDGTTDDTTAVHDAIDALVAAGRGVLYFPAGTYKITAALPTISVDCLILGDGPGMHYGGTLNSAVNFTSQTAVLFTVSAAEVTFRDIGLYNTYAGTPSAGSAIYVTSADASQKVSYQNVLVSGFYDNVDIAVGAAWEMAHCFIWAPVRYGVRVRNTVNADAGDWQITGTSFYGAVYDSTAGLRIESSGGAKIVNCKFNGALGQMFAQGIDLAVANSAQTSILLIANCSFENVSGDGIHATTGTAPSKWWAIEIVNCEFGLYSNNSGYGVSLNSTTAGDLSEVIIASCVFNTDGTARPAISLTKADNVILSNLLIHGGFNAFYTASSSTNVYDYTAPGGSGTPATTVTSETSWGITPAVGTDTEYARQDHTHGTPADPVGGLITVDPGTATIDSGDPFGVTLTSLWGIDAGVPYYDDGGAAAGEEAALMYDASTGHYVLIGYDF